MHARNKKVAPARTCLARVNKLFTTSLLVVVRQVRSLIRAAVRRRGGGGREDVVGTGRKVFTERKG